MAFLGYKGYKSGSSGSSVKKISFSDMLSRVDLDDMTTLVRNEYTKQGYIGDFGRQAFFEFDFSMKDNPMLSLDGCDYTRFMLYGRRPGKMPPVAPIENWMHRYRIYGSAWAVAKSISKNGTTGNDFLTPLLPTISKNIISQLKDIILKEIENN